MIKLIKYLRHYKKESIIGPLFKLLEACFELFQNCLKIKGRGNQTSPPF